MSVPGGRSGMVTAVSGALSCTLVLSDQVLARPAPVAGSLFQGPAIGVSCGRSRARCARCSTAAGRSRGLFAVVIVRVVVPVVLGPEICERVGQRAQAPEKLVQ